jgi:hypothetical protein
MKKQFTFLFLVIAASFSLYAFSTREKHVKQNPNTTSIWWDFNGTNSLQMGDNSKYTPDPNNSPDCVPVAGPLYCEIFAQTDGDSDPDDPKPDLSTITNQRMKF